MVTMLVNAFGYVVLPVGLVTLAAGWLLDRLFPAFGRRRLIWCSALLPAGLLLILTLWQIYGHDGPRGGEQGIAHAYGVVLLVALTPLSLLVSFPVALWVLPHLVRRRF